MAAMPLEIIQARSLTSRLGTASFLVDSEGTLLYFNEAAAELLGVTFEEAGQMESGTWGTQFKPREPGGREVPVGELPLAIAVQSGQPAYSRLQITGADGRDRDIEVAALPIMGDGEQAGALAIFWPVHGEGDAS
jgi:PAS domain S-box-containing protein